MKKITKILLSGLLLFSVSCTGAKAPVNTVEVKAPPVKNQIKMSFDVKALENESEIKSIEAFLTTNYDDPFSNGTNPFGDNNIVKLNINEVNSNIFMVFSNVPDGGPYYAVVSVYDKTVNEADRNNITARDETINSQNKRWGRSSNSATVNNGQVSFSNNTDAFIVSLKLKKLNQTGVDILPENGASTKGNIEVSQQELE